MDLTLDAVILAGGLGTRLRSVVEDTPKCLAPVQEFPFLMYKICQLRQAGIQRVILCVGYLAEQIEAYFQENPVSGVTIEFAYEQEPLGTAGAFKNAEPLIHSEHFLALNGDCYLEIDYAAFIACHIQKQAQASLAVVKAPDPSNYGLVMFDSGNQVQAFLEKQSIPPASHPEAAFYINAGTYCLHQSILASIPPRQPCSIERDVFPNLVRQDFYAYPLEGYFIDIGTPENFAQIQQDVLSGKLKMVS